MKDLNKTIITRLTNKEPVSRKTLLHYLKWKGFEISDRGLRMLIVRLRRKYGYLIQSSPSGYKLVTNVKEFEAHIEFKRKYAMSILAECRDMKKNFKRNLKPQLFL